MKAKKTLSAALAVLMLAGCAHRKPRHEPSLTQWYKAGGTEETFTRDDHECVVEEDARKGYDAQRRADARMLDNQMAGYSMLPGSINYVNPTNKGESYYYDCIRARGWDIADRSVLPDEMAQYGDMNRFREPPGFVEAPKPAP